MIIAEAGQSARETLNNNFGRTAGICETFGIGSIGAHRFKLIAVTRLDGYCESFIRAHFWTRRIRAVAANEFVNTPGATVTSQRSGARSRLSQDARCNVRKGLPRCPGGIPQIFLSARAQRKVAGVA